MEVGDDLPDEHHIMRHLQPTDMQYDDQGNIASIDLRADPDGISVNWVEYYSSQIDPFVSQMIALASKRTVRKSHRAAVFRVEKVKNTAKALACDASVIYAPITAPQPEDLSHSLVAGVSPDRQDVLAAVSMAFERVEAYPREILASRGNLGASSAPSSGA